MGGIPTNVHTEVLRPTKNNPDATIRGLMADSEAAKAGLREGDEVSYGVALDAVQGEVHRTLTLNVTRDGKTFPIVYLPRGEAVEAYQWERVSGIPEDRCKAPVGSAN